jgi:hypothetical protein
VAIVWPAAIVRFVRPCSALRLTRPLKSLTSNVDRFAAVGFRITKGLVGPPGVVGVTFCMLTYNTSVEHQQAPTTSDRLEGKFLCMQQQ